MPDLMPWLQGVYQALPHHNYGWWLTTREHQEVATLVTAVQFLYGRFGNHQISFSDDDYNDLYRALGRTVPANGARQVINRHLLLNMWRPLRLIEREQSNKINPFSLDEGGLELAQSAEPRRVLESILRQVRFVDPDWTRPGVITRYTGISVLPHGVLTAVLEGSGGYLSRQEYRLFVSRLRVDDNESVAQAVTLIQDFRAGPEALREQLISLEPPLFPTPKSYQDWVDMDLHTFSLFALGTHFKRIGSVLVLAGTAVDATVTNAFVFPSGSSQVETNVPSNVRKPIQRQMELRVPHDDPAADIPPIPNIEANSGQEAEAFVMRLLEANGFEVRDFSRLRGYGFDLWARHLDTGSIYYCEVKSSTNNLGTVELTRLEMEAAGKYRERFLLFCVEKFDLSESTGDVWVIQDPWDELPSLQTPKTTVMHSTSRTEWLQAAKKLE